LHVVYIPVVEKQILWSKRCKDKSLVGTVKETIMQVSSSKKWLSKPALDEAGNPILQKNGKPVLKKSYSVLQDDFFQHMRAAGYTDVERGERGSSEEHLTVTQFKVMQEEKRLEGLTEQIERSGTELAVVQQQLASGHAAIQQIESDTRKAEKAADAAERKMTQAEQALRTQSMTFMKIDSMGKKTLTGNIALAPDEARELKELAKKGVTADRRVSELEEKVVRAQKDAGIWKRRYEKLLDQVQPYLDAIKLAPERVRAFLNAIMTRPKETNEHTQPARRRGQDLEL
ncbi:MAG: plasmid recombination protein, partial [Clostridiales bacterium]|nr:plasmid recombination protein [Clostridiales bacterium]